jgi:hypothetical protein
MVKILMMLNMGTMTKEKHLQASITAKTLYVPLFTIQVSYIYLIALIQNVSEAVFIT